MHKVFTPLHQPARIKPSQSPVWQISICQSTVDHNDKLTSVGESQFKEHTGHPVKLHLHCRPRCTARPVAMTQTRTSRTWSNHTHRQRTWFQEKAQELWLYNSQNAQTIHTYNIRHLVLEIVIRKTCSVKRVARFRSRAASPQQLVLYFFYFFTLFIQIQQRYISTHV